MTDSAYNPSLRNLGDWELDIPHLHGVFSTSKGWQVSTSTPDARCSVDSADPSLGQPPLVFGSDNMIGFQPYQYWYGNSLYVPGSGDQKMMVIAGNAPRPSDGAQYRWITDGQWVMSCLQSTANGTGEGFLATAPDGTKYTFNWFSKRPMPSLSVTAGSFPFQTLSYLDRYEIYIYPTRAEDRFGNYVTYTYDDAHPWQLLSIQSSDGRSIALTYNATGLLATATAASRTWRYTYSTDFRLTEVLLPDSSKWVYDFSQKPANFGGSGWHDCADMYPVQSGSAIKTITHPSGAIGAFTFERRRHGRSNVPFSCLWAGSSSAPYDSKYVDAFALISKNISGPGLTAMTWGFSYAPSTGTWESECPGGTCSATRSVTVNQPDGSWQRSTFSNRYGVNEGKLLLREIGSGSQTLYSENLSYQNDPTGQPYPAKWGTIPCYRCDRSGEGAVPLKSRSVTQDGVTFNRQVNAYDSLARATSEAKSNTLGYSKTDTTEYFDHFGKWALGQISRATTNGVESSRIDYDLASALPIRFYAFGKLTQTLTYNADSTIASVSDGRDGIVGAETTISLSAWKRGVPQSVRYPATTESPSGATKSAVVNDDGTLASTTDENDYVTSFAYDALGRLAHIAYPPNDTVAWNAKDIEFRPLTAADWKPAGVVAGQWRQSITQGKYAKVTYVDAMWRPVLVHEYDIDNTPGTLRSTSTTYDVSSRVAFQSYPSTDLIPSATGTWSFYDALDRVTSVKQDSELGQQPLTTSTEYLAGFKTRVTNPRGFFTTTNYLAYDQPITDWPVAITHPEGAFTDITRDVFGKPKSLVRHNADNSQSVARNYVYDGYQQLCKTVEPETGSTVMLYDEAGNLTHTWSGLPQNSTADCSYDAAWSSGHLAWRRYDARNRVDALRFADGHGDQNLAYTKDGLLSEITTYNDPGSTTPVVNTYTYNKRRLLTGESMSQPGWYTWGLGYTYDTNGALLGQSYPTTGLYVDYAPNALGQATKAGTYATGVSYYPNGGIKQFTYGNGLTHTMTQNLRQLPARVTDGGGALDYDYGYDANGNVDHVYDYIPDLTPGTTARHRWMQYDELDRLTAVQSAMFGGDQWHRFAYDTLDNLKSWKLTGVKDYANYYYDANNRLTNIQNSSGASIVGLGYDVQGNLQNKNGQNYSFDYGNRLREVTGKESYRYDAQGRRVLAWSPTQGSILSQYSQVGQLLYQNDERKAKALEYVYLGGSLVAIREQAYGGAYTTKYQHTDALGSPVAVTDQSAQVIERTQWEPYGAAINKTVDGVGYSGQVMDAATGLINMQQRYYDPQVGRFLSVDPITAYTSLGASFNRYWYASNNPYSRTDPDGRRDIYIGGASDKDSSRLVQNYAETQKQLHPDRDIQYFGWHENERIQAALEAPLAKGEPLNVIGHSLGGGEAVSQANETSARITNLVTIDPVGGAGSGSKPENVSNWVNVIAQTTTKVNFSDAIAYAGRVFQGVTNLSGADISKTSSANHGDFTKMMKDADASQLINSSYTDKPQK
ncbi:hypothetical protein GCM10027159_25770 [Lysobacter terrae]